MSETNTQVKPTPSPWQVFGSDPTTIYGPNREFLASFDPTHLGPAASGYAERVANTSFAAEAPRLKAVNEALLEALKALVFEVSRYPEADEWAVTMGASAAIALAEAQP